MCLRLLRAEVWAGTDRKIHRVTARLVEDKELQDVVVVAHGRLVVLGGDNHRIHEELISAGGRLREGRFARLNVGETNAALDAGLPEAAPEAVLRRLVEIWSTHKEPLMSALEARMRDRTANLGSILERRAAREVKDMTTILRELERNILAELNQYDKPRQMLFQGWTLEEQDQFERNLAGIRERVARVPEEIAQETEAIRKRYSGPSPRLFPVAVTYLVPRRIAREMEGRG